MSTTMVYHVPRRPTNQWTILTLRALLACLPFFLRNLIFRRVWVAFEPIVWPYITSYDIFNSSILFIIEFFFGC
jgi:hypothetical protein